jgi:Predicted RNA polymerase sigma factor containing a TPR repeat domain
MTAADRRGPDARDVEDLLRELAPRVLGTVARKYRDFDAAEDAVQEALLAAATQWPTQGVPDNPDAWVVTAASRRLINMWRADAARRRREDTLFALDNPTSAAAVEAPAADHDDTLLLLFLCCHPSLTHPSAVALTLRAVGGLTTAQIAAAFLVPEATMAQRISRAKQSIARAGARFELPDRDGWRPRLDSVLKVIYLMFSEGYASLDADGLLRPDLTREAIRLTRLLRRLLPDEAEVAGLLALMLLTDARRDARTGPHGELIPLARQDRGRWDRVAIAEGVRLIDATLRPGSVGPYQVQAAIAALHDEAPNVDETDWPQILALYGVLERIAPGPMVTLNRAVALAMVDGPRAGLALLATVEDTLSGHYRLAAVRGHLLEMAGDREGALTQLRAAAAGTRSRAEQAFLLTEIARLASVRSAP